ncbi:hypothetical protein OESDEN_02129 [Oesophagostomum dentatum]|uniref:Uncharacterized protein n=1 Tax=Oesophagostomum dentatum TaxID=61180 RepID=A0A0B1TR64_OESDE|nr:hypothetical protein OESDEN_02129 [Oesophagostomum dentatum]
MYYKLRLFTSLLILGSTCNFNEEFKLYGISGKVGGTVYVTFVEYTYLRAFDNIHQSIHRYRLSSPLGYYSNNEKYHFCCYIMLSYCSLLLYSVFLG